MQCRNISCRACEICDDCEILNSVYLLRYEIEFQKANVVHVIWSALPIHCLGSFVCSIRLRPAQFSLAALTAVLGELLQMAGGQLAFACSSSPGKWCIWPCHKFMFPSRVQCSLCNLHGHLLSRKDVLHWSSSNIYTVACVMICHCQSSVRLSVRKLLLLRRRAKECM